MRNFAALFSLILLIGIMVPPAQATSTTYQDVEIIDTEFGRFEVEITTTVYDLLARSGSRRADKTATVKDGDAIIAQVTLSANFGFDGTTSWVISASGSHTTYSGWSYGNESITSSGGTATLTATLSHLLHRNIAVNISLTCSPTGQIS